MATAAGLYVYTNGQWFNRNAGATGGSGTPVKPSAATTGVPSGTTLTSRSSSSDVIIDGTNNPSWVTGNGTSANPYLIDAVDLAISGGVLKIRTANVKISRSKIHTSYFGTTGTAVINCTSSSLPTTADAVVVQDCEIYNDLPSMHMDGVLGHGFTLRRCNIYHTTDGIGTTVTGSQTDANVTVDACWVHGLTYFEGVYAPNAPDYSSLSNSSTVVNSYGDSNKPDGSHSDCIQLQGGRYVTITNNFLDGRFDSTMDGNGSTTWIRKGTNFALSDPAGNGVSPWGTYNANSAIQLNNNQSGAPIDYVTMTGNWIGGGRFASVNWSGSNYGTYGTFTGHVFEGNRMIGDGGYTIPPWSASGQFGYNSDGSPKTGAMPQSASAGYTLNFGSSSIDQSNIAYDPTNNPNVNDADNSLAQWHVGSSTVVRNG